MNLVYFAMSAALGIIGWFTIFATLIWPRIKNQSRLQRLKLLTTMNFFRYFGSTMLMTGLVVRSLPKEFANPAAFGDLITLILAYVAFIVLQRSSDNNARLSIVWLVNIFGAGDLLLAVILGPLFIKDPATFGFAYFIPTFYVPLLFAGHFYSFKTLLERSPR